MRKRFYSARTNPIKLTLEELYWKFQHLYLFFRERDYFKGKAGITGNVLPDEIKHEAALVLRFQPFPVTKWDISEITEDNIRNPLPAS